MPVGANDFSRDWYSYDETPDDFALAHFSIANDLETLIPFYPKCSQVSAGAEALGVGLESANLDEVQ